MSGWGVARAFGRRCCTDNARPRQRRWAVCTGDIDVPNGGCLPDRRATEQ